MSKRAIRRVRISLGHRLRALRKARGLSQERLGDRCGLCSKFIGEVERGEKSISMDSLYRVSRALNIPLADMIDLGQGAPRRTRRPTATPTGRRSA